MLEMATHLVSYNNIKAKNPEFTTIIDLHSGKGFDLDGACAIKLCCTARSNANHKIIQTTVQVKS